MKTAYDQMIENETFTPENIPDNTAQLKRDSSAISDQKEVTMAEDTKEKPNKPTSPTPAPEPTKPGDHGNK